MATNQVLERENMRLKNINLNLDNRLKELMLKECQQRELEHDLKLVSNQDYAIKGYKQFVEKDPEVIISNSLTYGEWYKGLVERMKSIEFLYDEYLFCKVKVTSNTKWRTDFISGHYSSNGGIQESVQGERVYLHVRDEGWTHENTEHVLVLHPAIPDKTMGLFPYKRDYGDPYKAGFDQWRTERRIPQTYYADQECYVLVCKKGENKLNHEEYMVKGCEKFIGGDSSISGIEQDYEAWYQGLTKKMIFGQKYNYEEHVFREIEVTKKELRGKSKLTLVTEPYEYLEPTNLKIQPTSDSWNNESIKHVLVLHPNSLEKSLKMVWSGSEFVCDGVDTIPQEYYVENKGFILVLCKNE